MYQSDLHVPKKLTDNKRGRLSRRNSSSKSDYPLYWSEEGQYIMQGLLINFIAKFIKKLRTINMYYSYTTMTNMEGSNVICLK